MRTIGFTLLLLLGLPTLNASAQSAKAIIEPTSEDSSAQGIVQFKETPDGLAMSAQINGVAPGNHGFHIHDYGDCSNSGKAAGGHYNPQATPHGFLPHDGHGASHAGDMGNLEIDEAGTGSLELVLPGITLTTGPASVAGRAVILHANADDFGQPTGNAGGRIGCGTIILISE